MGAAQSRSHLRTRAHGERGASLAIVLAIVIVLGLVVGAMLTQGQAGVMSVKAVRQQRTKVFGAESAVDGAVNYMRGDRTRGRLNVSPCNGGTAFTGPSNVGTVTVTCAAQSTSGAPQAGVNWPAYAIQTTTGISGYPTGMCSGTGNPGICVGGGSSGVMKVDGSVTSNSSIVINNSADLDAGDDPVTAYGACSGTIVGTPVTCNTGAYVSDPGGAANVDPSSGGWASDIQTLPPEAPAPTCNKNSRVATMVPGSYFDRNAMLAGFVNGTTSCPVVWMQPGDYYFDLDQATDMDPWRIGYWDGAGSFSGSNTPGSIVIGGTPVGWSASATTSQLSLVNTPGACNRTQPGVHVVMAGYTAFDVKDEGELELCPDPNTTKQQIALYGRKTNQTASPITALYKPLGASAASPSSLGTPFSSLQSIDGVFTQGAVSGNSKTASVSLDTYSAAAGPPAASLGTVSLKIAHREVVSPTSSTLTITAKIILGDGSSPSSCTTTSAFTKQTALTSQTWTVPSSCVNSLGDLSGADVQWSVKTASSGSPSLTAYLDGAELSATYTPRALEQKVPGSKIVWMYGDYGDQKPQIYIWGTVYAPTSRIELGFGGVATTIARFGRGVVVAALKAIDVEVNQSFTAFGNASGVPVFTDRDVDLVAWIGGKRQLRARVKFDDQDPTTPGKTVKVTAWNAVN